MTVNNFNRRKTVHLIILLVIIIGIRPSFGQTGQKNNFFVFLGGDICFAETYQSKLEEKGKTNILKAYGYDYSMSKIAPLLLKADLVIANLETPLTDIVKSPFSEDEKYRIHKGDTKETPSTLKKYKVNVVSLANNHSMDYGKLGLEQTLKILKENFIAYFGAGLDEKEASLPYRYNYKEGKENFHIIIIGGLNYSSKYDEEYKFYAGTNVAGVKSWTRAKVTEQINVIRSTDSTAFIIAYPHWFENYVWKTEKQTELAHAMIEAGADMVVGHGTHMFQETELYRDKWIIYSLGNLVFNSPGRYKKKAANPYSFTAMLEISRDKNNLLMNLRLYPVLSNNLETNYQPRFLSKNEIKAALELFSSHSINIIREKDYETGKDEIGYFINLKIKHAKYGNTPCKCNH